MTLASIAFANESWAWVAVAFGMAASLAVFLTYRRSHLRGFTKVVAITLKLAGFALLALALLEPVHLEEVPKSHSNDVAILADNSAGLALNLGGGSTPADELRGALVSPDPENPLPWIAAIAETFRVQPFLVDRGLRQVTDFTRLDFTRNSSTLGAALENLEMRFRGRPLAATVLLTDGNATDRAALEDRIAELEAAPDEKRVPVFPVVLGRLGEAARDLSVDHVETMTTQFEDAQVTLNVEASVLGSYEEPLELFVTNEKGEEIAMKEIAFAPGQERRSTPARLRLGGMPPGISFLTVGIRAANGAKPAQLTDKNDAYRVTVNRGNGPYRILYLSGRPNWEFKFLRRAIAGDAELDLVGLIRIARREPKFEYRGGSGESSNPLFRGFNRNLPEETQRYDEPVLVRLNTASAEELRDGFPKVAEELYTRYRAIIIDDLEAEFFTAEQQLLIEQFVSLRGGTVVMLGGQESFQQGGWDNTPTGRLLPVYLEELTTGPAALEAAYNLTREGWLEDWMRLRTSQDDEETRLAYMPPFFAINQLTAIKPGANLLATVTDSEQRVLPAVVTQRYGEGRSAAVAVADFWRWGMKDSEQQAELGKMWRQLLRWAVNDVPARVEVEKRESLEGAIPVTDVSIRVRDLEFRPQDDATVSISVKDLDGSTRALTAEPSLEEPGLFTAAHVSEESKGYRIEAKVIDGEGREVGSGEVARAFNPEAAEYARLGPDEALLGRLAAATGGELIRVDGLAGLAERLQQLDLPLVEVKQKPLWHSPWLFLIALLCFLGEWSLRRRKGTI